MLSSNTLTLNENILAKIRKFLKFVGAKQFRYRPSLFPPKGDKILGKIELVSDGEEIWWEQTTGKNYSKRRRLPDFYSFNQKINKWENFSELYILIPDYINEFFKFFALDYINRAKQKEKYANQ